MCLVVCQRCQCSFTVLHTSLLRKQYGSVMKKPWNKIFAVFIVSYMSDSWDNKCQLPFDTGTPRDIMGIGWLSIKNIHIQVLKKKPVVLKKTSVVEKKTLVV